MKMKPGDPAYWMLNDGFESTPVVHKQECYICNDPEYARMGLPLCRKCPLCGGHIAADDKRCDDCGLDEQSWYKVGKAVFLDEEWEPVEPNEYQNALVEKAAH